VATAALDRQLRRFIVSPEVERPSEVTEVSRFLHRWRFSDESIVDLLNGVSVMLRIGKELLSFLENSSCARDISLAPRHGLSRDQGAVAVRPRIVHLTSSGRLKWSSW
jgi:hypothetical protein